MAKRKITPEEMLKGASTISIAANRLDDMESNIKEILGYLQNDMKTGTPGLVQKEIELRRRIEALERLFDKIWFKLGLTSILGGGAVAAVMKFIFKL